VLELDGRRASRISISDSVGDADADAEAAGEQTTDTPRAATVAPNPASDHQPSSLSG